MNIFFFSEDVEVCAKGLCDQHLRKMIVEYAQLLSNAHHQYNSPSASVVYKATHKHHPCSIWVCARTCHYIWLYDLLEACLDEFRIRFQKGHATERIANSLRAIPGYFQEEELQFELPPNLTPYRDWGPLAGAYRTYYIDKLNSWITRIDKRRITPTWTNVSTPFWLDWNSEKGKFTYKIGPDYE